MAMLTARAAVLHAPGTPMTIEEIHLRQPEHDEVLVRTVRVGICGTDLHFAGGRFPYPTPTVLGHEASGTIEATGPGVTTVRPGDRVAICDQIPCGRCGPCLSGRMVYCTDTGAKQRQRGRLRLGRQALRQYLGVSALADLMVLDAAAVIPIPGTISSDAAALLGCCLTGGAATIFNTARLQPGQTVLVIGCGAVGLGAIQAARIGGATRIIAADPEPHRRQIALDVGATDTIDPNDHDITHAVHQLTRDHGVDIAVEAVGDPTLVTAAFSGLAPGGQAIVIGMLPPGSRLQIPASLLRHGRRLAGSVMGEVRTHHDIPTYARMVTHGELIADQLATAHWPLDDINHAFDNAAARRGIRTMITF